MRTLRPTTLSPSALTPLTRRLQASLPPERWAEVEARAHERVRILAAAEEARAGGLSRRKALAAVAPDVPWPTSLRWGLDSRFGHLAESRAAGAMNRALSVAEPGVMAPAPARAGLTACEAIPGPGPHCGLQAHCVGLPHGEPRRVPKAGRRGGRRMEGTKRSAGARLPRDWPVSGRGSALGGQDEGQVDPACPRPAGAPQSATRGGGSGHFCNKSVVQAGPWNVIAVLTGAVLRAIGRVVAIRGAPPRQ